ncbi:MAG: erythromycin esterase family protein, partial [Proteobacteria bacterium]|nr:erythromycin esterase family protein [Pseudomonadota bacterium]
MPKGIPIEELTPHAISLSNPQALKERLQGVEVIYLGEATHGDGATFAAKWQLIQFLHEEMGFDVLAFEADLVTCELAANRGLSGSALIQYCSLAQWFRSTNVTDGVKWLDSSGTTGHGDKPLHLAGFDCQAGPMMKKEWVPRLRDFLVVIDSQVPSDPQFEQFSRLLDRLAHWNFYEEVERRWPSLSQLEQTKRLVKVRPKKAEREAFFSTLKTIEGQTRDSDHIDSAMWVRIYDSIRGLAGMTWADKTDIAERNRLRDAQMGANLLALAKGHKVIAWGATIHGIHDSETLGKK